jgi:RNA polymerase sigma-32 factor
MLLVAPSVEMEPVADLPREKDLPGLSSGGAFAVYLSEIRRIPLLTPARERELARAYRQHKDHRAFDLLVTSNLRFVVQVARTYRSYGRRISDLIQEGTLGLIRAVERYDPDRDIRLVSYAVWWIRAHIQAYILRTWSIVKVGTTQVQRRLFYALARTKRELERRGDSLPPSLEPAETATVAGRLGVTTKQVEEMTHRLHQRDLSLDASVGEDGPTHLESMAWEGPSQDELLGDAQQQAQAAVRVGAALAQLDPRERTVVQSRLMSDSPMTFQEVGDVIGCSPERARQLETRAKLKLRRLLEATEAER